jgi:hypothetical protein
MSLVSFSLLLLVSSLLARCFFDELLDVDELRDLELLLLRSVGLTAACGAMVTRWLANIEGGVLWRLDLRRRVRMLD